MYQINEKAQKCPALPQSAAWPGVLQAAGGFQVTDGLRCTAVTPCCNDRNEDRAGRGGRTSFSSDGLTARQCENSVQIQNLLFSFKPILPASRLGAARPVWPWLIRGRSPSAEIQYQAHYQCHSTATDNQQTTFHRPNQPAKQVTQTL